MEQEHVEGQEYGSLFVRVYFNHDSLCVEVLQARNVIPLDPNGKEGRLVWGVISFLDTAIEMVDSNA